MALLDLLGRRWSLRVIWELREAPATFRQLRERCDGLSPTVLNTRLKELRDSGVIKLSDHAGYTLTHSGAALLRAIAPLNRWAKAWARKSEIARR
jgi:DNA-binding HxlR family transcriptional regulator